jgi:hypothetical protein
MRIHLSISIVATFFIGFAIGFSILLIYQNKLIIIGQYSGLISGIIGGVISLLGVIINLLKENVFEYGEIYKMKQIRPEYQEGGWIPKETARYHETAYFLRIVKRRGKGRLEECDGRITIDGRFVIPVSWQGSSYEKFRNISTEDDLEIINFMIFRRTLVLHISIKIHNYRRVLSVKNGINFT